ncbi:hypothetical protein [Pseudonocardia alni]|uniref:hypothetical protein n=1 Tax=Pseudonocardia alni TaxID=33907 RepID=UPI001AD7B1C3|nr:hypothetical protein [Pseudonocardia alni]MBO4240378.1 hypothetical protein [Pseudonocardia alni]
MSGGTVYASQAVTAPPPVSVVASAPTGAGSPALQLPVSTFAADSIAAARSAVDDALAAEAEAAAAEAAQPRYICEPAADARVIDGIIVNKDCPELNAAKEQAQRQYATSGEAQYDYYVDGPGAGEVAQKNALQACREQTGMTTAQCQADAAAGNAN